ncbi:MAG: lysophospholipid acyltransferase family protein [Meiothermus sp.]|nr:lysophospholipid acyltransferase family protein [Meiothermus sp.]
MRFLFFLKVEGLENIPREGPVIIVSNHMSFVDPVLVGATVPRTLAYIARADMFKYPVLGWWMRAVNTIPLERGAGDLGAIKAAIRAIKDGKVFGIFPEGRRSRTGQIEPFKTGAAAIALRTDAVLVPMAIIGSDKAWPVGGFPRPFRPIKVVFGEPIMLPTDPAERKDLGALTSRLEAAVTALLPAEYHRKPIV